MADRAKNEKNAKDFKVLSVDTATDVCSAALADLNGTIVEVNFMRGQTHSKHLAAMVAALLDLAGLRIDGVDAFAADAGPGTFTGLRIGLALVKGLAAANGKPAVGVSSLDVLAAQAGFPEGRICCMLDARRGEVYTARYETRDGQIEKISAEIAAAPQQALAANNGPCIYIGTGAMAYRDVILETAGRAAWFAAEETNHPRASTVARLGLRLLQNEQSGDPTALVPNYIRKSDAEYNKMR